MRKAAAALITLSSLLVTITKAWTSPVLIKSSRSFTLSKLEAIKAELPDLLKEFDLTGGRPGAIVETEEELARKEEIQRELDDRGYPDWLEEYGESLEEVGAEYDIDDPEAIDSSTLGTWDIHDLNSEFDYEWKPENGKPDPNLIDVTKEDYIPANPVDEDGIEVGWTAMFGASNPIDTRTIVGTKDSFMVDEETKDDSLLTPLFDDDDAEISYNEDIRTFRKSLDIIETYVDPFLPENMQVPRHVAKWHGYPMPKAYPQKNYTNNRFTKEEHVTPFDDYDPHKARKLAVQYARAKNCEWLPAGVSEKEHKRIRAPYEACGTLVGTLRKGECDEEIVERIKPALKILGSCAELLSITDGTVFRFYYHGLMKNKFGMAAWTESLIRDCGAECTGVVFETGFRRRDPAYDGGDHWYGPY
mmetsp:Transcript_20386/g.36982  ORF Transcript_20386/g.36982 Transcript_20386/m.36982 type:complete len:417 (-) Transcript_20386:359-1609(-)